MLDKLMRRSGIVEVWEWMSWDRKLQLDML
jgi:hypothetical protein